MALNRRTFFTTLGAFAGTALASQAGAQEHPELDCDNQWSVLVDTTLCIGCRKCEWACNNHHKLSDRPLQAYDDKSVLAERRRPTADAYTVVNTFEDKGHAKTQTIKLQCMHCNHPACASACIVGALHKDPRGPVVYDAWKCIGCRYCMVACPFQVPAYEYHNAFDPQVRKCTFCIDRLESGEMPACVSICPNEALTFGRRSDLLEVAHTRLYHNPDRYFPHIYGETEAGGTSWLYLAGTDLAGAVLPKLDERPAPETTEWIQHGIFRSFVPPLALYALLGLIMHSTRKTDVQPEAPVTEVRHDDE